MGSKTDFDDGSTRTSGERYLGAPTTSGPSMKQQWINAKVVQGSCVMYGRVKR
jgi:hypothetical protein